MAKKIYDYVHGFIRFNELESELIDSFAFQRLHYIRQLGIAYLVYPGAKHARFEHSLGTMELATRIFDFIVCKDTFEKQDTDNAYWRQILRLAALCHDMGHLPFSHVAEALLLGKGGHERWTLEIIKSPDLEPIWEKVQKLFPKRHVMEDVVRLSIGEKKLKEMGIDLTFNKWEKALCQVITADFFGADRIDYLLRDAQSTGLSYGLFDYHQLIEMLCILPQDDQLEIGIDENGIESCEALLLARHFMHKRLYQYPSVKAYSFHLSRFMYSVYGRGSKMHNLDEYLLFNDNEVLNTLMRALKDPTHPGHDDAHCLLVRHHRFKAFEVSESISEEDVLNLKNELNIPDYLIAFDFSAKRAKKVEMLFPVLKRNGNIVDATTCSKILIPTTPACWIYVAPEYEEQVYTALENKLL